MIILDSFSGRGGRNVLSAGLAIVSDVERKCDGEPFTGQSDKARVLNSLSRFPETGWLVAERASATLYG